MEVQIIDKKDTAEITANSAYVYTGDVNVNRDYVTNGPFDKLRTGSINIPVQGLPHSAMPVLSRVEGT